VFIGSVKENFTGHLHWCFTVLSRKHSCR